MTEVKKHFENQELATRNEKLEKDNAELLKISQIIAAEFRAIAEVVGYPDAALEDDTLLDAVKRMAAVLENG